MELNNLVQSGENWQVVLHHGQGGDVIIEVKRTRRIVPPRKQQGTTIAQK